MKHIAKNQIRPIRWEWIFSQHIKVDMLEKVGFMIFASKEEAVRKSVVEKISSEMQMDDQNMAF